MHSNKTIAASKEALSHKSLEYSYKGKKVLITGHTGFKGSWLTQWLLQMEAHVFGYSLEPPTDPCLYSQLHLERQVEQQIADIRDFDTLKAWMKYAQPDIIFHLAAQPLVRESYLRPLETVQVNTMGTLHVLEAVRQLNLSTVVVAITTDKCYENKEWEYGYREADPMGGYDPYSSSKGAAEIFISSWRNSFFHPEKIAEHGVRLASVRAGNVIGGGDWAKDRIVPDCMNSLYSGNPIEVRSPYATRPWQHVLEPLGGYLSLGAKLLEADAVQAKGFCEAFNFGPYISGNRTVMELVEKVIHYWGGGTWHLSDLSSAPHEAQLLHLCTDKAHHRLNWHPQWTFEETIRETTRWYKAALEEKSCIVEITNEQITAYHTKLHLLQHEPHEYSML